MFTGIVERATEVTDVQDHAGGRRLTLAHDWRNLTRGESVAVNGCCLTVAHFTTDRVSFDVIRETLDRTNLGGIAAGDRVHVERSLRADSRIDGHFVQGHVDAPAELVDRQADDEEWRLRVRVPEAFAKYLVPKGSVAIDGVSLTLADVNDDVFEVALIPTTLEKTALGDCRIGYRFNFEADILSKTIVSHLERMGVGNVVK